MKNRQSQLNTLRFLATIELALIVCAVALPAWGRYLLQAAVIFGGVLAGQLFFHSSSIGVVERPSEAEQVRLNLSH